MTEEQFRAAEEVMLRGMEEDVHDAGHIYRVLYTSLRIARTEPAAKLDVVVLAALLHDIGRAPGQKEDTAAVIAAEAGAAGAAADAPAPMVQRGEEGQHGAASGPGGPSGTAGPEAEAAPKEKAGHAERGAAMAYTILRQQGWSGKTAAHVRDCIATHSYRGGLAPQSLEAKILFDADKLDLSGAMGVARAMLYGARIGEPLYLVGKRGKPGSANPAAPPSLMREYRRKLAKMEGRFFTAEGRRLGKKRQKAMDAYFAALRSEVYKGYKKGVKLLDEVLAGH